MVMTRGMRSILSQEGRRRDGDLWEGYRLEDHLGLQPQSGLTRISVVRIVANVMIIGT